MPVSRILSGLIIYLCSLPSGIGRATLKRRFTWPCNLPVRTAAGIATDAGRLLPHLFTLIRGRADGYFLLRQP